MRGPANAVFLSYAREDADAARRIAEAVRAAGLAVWFDGNELHSGPWFVPRFFRLSSIR